MKATHQDFKIETFTSETSYIADVFEIDHGNSSIIFKEEMEKMVLEEKPFSGDDDGTVGEIRQDEIKSVQQIEYSKENHIDGEEIPKEKVGIVDIEKKDDQTCKDQESKEISVEQEDLVEEKEDQSAAPLNEVEEEQVEQEEEQVEQEEEQVEQAEEQVEQEELKVAQEESIHENIDSKEIKVDIPQEKQKESSTIPENETTIKTDGLQQEAQLEKPAEVQEDNDIKTDEIEQVKAAQIQQETQETSLQHEKHDLEDDSIKPLIDEDVYKQGEIHQQQQDTSSQDSGFDSRITIKENGVELRDESSEQPDKEYLDKEVKNDFLECISENLNNREVQ